MEALDHIDRLPGLTAAEQSRWEAHCVKRHIVLAQKLDVVDVPGLPPPAAPVALGGFRIRPFFACSQVSDGCVEPNVEDFCLKAAAWYRNAPGEVARDAAVAQV